MPSLKSKPKRLRRNLKRRLMTIIRDGDLDEAQVATLVDNFVDEFYELLEAYIDRKNEAVVQLKAQRDAYKRKLCSPSQLNQQLLNYVQDIADRPCEDPVFDVPCACCDPCDAKALLEKVRD